LYGHRTLNSDRSSTGSTARMSWISLPIFDKFLLNLALRAAIGRGHSASEVFS